MNQHWWALSFVTLLSSLVAQASGGEVAVHGNFTCDELTRWVGTEKHYSNQYKNNVFDMLKGKDCRSRPHLFFRNIQYGCSKGMPVFAEQPKQITPADASAVLLLSNFSINNNYSHFLHALLRLFCALLDARWIEPDGSGGFVRRREFVVWVDEWFKLTDEKRVWIGSLGGSSIRKLTAPGSSPSGTACPAATEMIYGSGCVQLLPPEKWFGYPGCRANVVLPAFSTFFRQVHKAQGPHDFRLTAGMDHDLLRVQFAVRDASIKTGARAISNLQDLQYQLIKSARIPVSLHNVTYEHLDVASTVRIMASTHIFVSMHGAGMTNMFFMNSNSAVIEIIPFPLCSCKSPDYFYGSGSYYHGSAMAQKILHYTYCVPKHHVVWHKKPPSIDDPQVKCSWRHLHSVESVFVDPDLFVSLVHKAERDLIAVGTVMLGRPIINMNSHANG